MGGGGGKGIFQDCITKFANLQVMIFWVVTPCSDVVGCQRFGGPCCLHLQGEGRMNAARPSDNLVSYHITTQCRNPEDHDVIPYLGPIHFTLQMDAA
jgi:hypothetical protein